MNRFSRLARSVLIKIPKRNVSTRLSEDKGVFEYMMITIPIVSFGLGTWQVYRWQRKLDLIEMLEKRTKFDEPIELPSRITDWDQMEYRRVKVRGHFDHSKEQCVGPRHRFDSGGSSGNNEGSLISRTKGSDIFGLYVITPFETTDGRRILVNRGWIPWRQMDVKTRSEGQIEGEIELTGVIRKSETRPPFGAKHDFTKDYLAYKDIDILSERLDAEKILIDADESCTVPGGPIGGQTRVNLRNEHVSYILTWYTLCFVTLALYRRSISKTARKMVI